MMPLRQRTKALEDFKRDPDIDVLILSGVGMVGLNVAFANILIILVSPCVLCNFSDGKLRVNIVTGHAVVCSG